MVPPQEELEAKLPVTKPNKATLESPPSTAAQATWLGHAAMLLQVEGWNVLADPIFSERCSMSQRVGPKRVRPSPVQAEDLPPVDVVVISHNHYDHLDYNSVMGLAQKDPPPLW